MKSIPKEILEKERSQKWKEKRLLEQKLQILNKDIEAINNQLERTL